LLKLLDILNGDYFNRDVLNFLILENKFPLLLISNLVMYVVPTEIIIFKFVARVLSILS